MASKKKNTSGKGAAAVLSRAVSSGDLCLVCAEPLTSVGIGECNHKSICSICVLRMRTLQDDHSCCLCKQDLERVVITSTTTKNMSDFEIWGERGNGLIYDEAAGAFFDDPDFYAKFQHLRSFSCRKCKSFRGENIEALKEHLLSAHKLYFCDLCLKGRHLFLQEQALFTSSELQTHTRKGDSNTPFKGHPECHFCGTLYYEDNERWDHLRQEHFSCFLCARNPDRKNEFYPDYNQLEEHFRQEHFLCEDPQCLDKKFIAFGSEMDLAHHMLTEHKTSAQGVRRKAIVVPIHFRYPSPPRYPGRGRGTGRPYTDPSSSAAYDTSTSELEVNPTDFPGLSSGGGGGSAIGGRGIARKLAPPTGALNLRDSEQFPGLSAPKGPAPNAVVVTPSSGGGMAARIAGRGVSSSYPAAAAAAAAVVRPLPETFSQTERGGPSFERADFPSLPAKPKSKPATAKPQQQRQAMVIDLTKDKNARPLSASGGAGRNKPAPAKQEAQAWQSKGKKQQAPRNSVPPAGENAEPDDSAAAEVGGAAVMKRIKTLLPEEEFEKFRSCSALFRRGELSGFEYYSDFADIFLVLHKRGLIDALISLLPEESKREELRALHGEGMSMRYS